MNCLKPNLLICGDNIKAVRYLSDNGITGIKLAYLDPPYCSNTSNEHYSDRFDGIEYAYYLRSLLRQLLLVVDNDGIIAIQTDSAHSFDIKHLMDDIVGNLSFRGQIVVGKNDHKRYGGEPKKLISGYDCLLLYTKNPEMKLPALIEKRNQEQDGEWTSFYTTNPISANRYRIFGIDVKVGSWRKSQEWASNAIANYLDLLRFVRSRNLPDENMEQCIRDYRDFMNLKNEDLSFLRYQDHSVQYYLPPSWEKHLTDNWSDINIRGCSTDFEHEVSMMFFERLFNWLTQKDDIIIDPFLGSGASIHVASKLNRKWIGIEKEAYCKTVILKTIKSIESEVCFHEIN